jgi:hypothetical protein
MGEFKNSEANDSLEGVRAAIPACIAASKGPIYSSMDGLERSMLQCFKKLLHDLHQQDVGPIWALLPKIVHEVHCTEIDYVDAGEINIQLLCCLEKCTSV